MTAANYLPRTITETHRKAIQKREAYEAKRKQKTAEITPENEPRVRDLMTQFAFALRHVNFAVKALKDIGVFPTDVAIHDQVKVFADLEAFFIESEKRANPDWISEFNNFEDYIWNFTHHTPENKDRIIKFAASLWKKR